MVDNIFDIIGKSELNIVLFPTSIVKFRAPNMTLTTGYQKSIPTIISRLDHEEKDHEIAHTRPVDSLRLDKDPTGTPIN